MGRMVIVGTELVVSTTAGVGLASGADCTTNGNDIAIFVAVGEEGINGIDVKGMDEVGS